MARPENNRLRTLRRRLAHLVRLLDEDQGKPGTSQRDYLLAEVTALTWAIQELEDVRPELHAHTVKVVKETLVKHLRSRGVDESVIEMVRHTCNTLSLTIGKEPLALGLAMEIAERDG
jgi:hypothetical protein